MSNKRFVWLVLICIGGYFQVNCNSKTIVEQKKDKKPNIVFFIADDWGWPHAGVYNDEFVKTPSFDRIANEGVLFEHAYVSSPSCTASRGAILTGQYHWRLGEGANLWSTLDVGIPVYPLILENAGYEVGYWRKCWGPGNIEAGGYSESYPGGKNYPDGFKQFLDSKDENKPFCFWFGASDPHRPYDSDKEMKANMDIQDIKVPGFYPDTEIIRSDIADYYVEVQEFDQEVGEVLKLLEERGELENTILVMTGDHGMPFPRVKSNIYDMGVRVPLAIRWGLHNSKGRTVKDFVSLVDLAPTFLDAAGVEIPEEMSGSSILKILQSKKEGWIEKDRDHVVFGKERHVPAQLAPSLDGYPSRGIRTKEYLYIRNFEPDRWPAGVPSGATHPMGTFADCDNGPTKSFLIEYKDDPEIKRFYELSFGKRPYEELYNIENDPFQMKNLIEDNRFLATKKELSKQLDEFLKKHEDPRVQGQVVKFDSYPYRARYKLKNE